MKRILLTVIAIICILISNAQQINLKLLPDIVSNSDQNIEQKFSEYVSTLTGSVTNETDINIVFELRDSLLLDLQKVIESYYYAMNQQQYQTWENVEIELDTIGFRVIYAEGVFVGLDVAPILVPKIKRYASEEFKLYANFRNEYSKSLGGEYPFSNVYGAFNAVYAGEKLIKNYPQSYYTQLIIDDFKKSLFLVTDIHKATTSSDGVTGCFYSNFTYQFYPYFSDCSAIEKIIVEKPNSFYTNILKELYSNMSDILIQENKPKELSVIYAVVTDKSDSRDIITDKIYNYLNSGIGIVHNLTIDNGSVTEYYACYRFYSNKSKAETALDFIKPDFPDSKIIEIVVVDPYQNAKMRNNQ